MRFNVYGALVPEGQAVIVDLVERVAWKVFGRVCAWPSADVVTAACELEEGRRVFSKRLLEQDLRRFGLQCRNIRVLEYGCEVYD